MTVRKILLRILILIFLSPVVLIIIIYLNYQLISFSAKDRIYYDLRKIPFRTYTLLPGSGTFQPEKWTNHTLIHRLEAVKKLYFGNKTIYIISSGSRKSETNDEPGDMKRYLMEDGISERNILTDTTGTRTWKSVMGSYRKFPGEKIIIVSQKEQLERALFIAGCIGSDAIGYVASPSPELHRYWTYREYLARVKCTYDCVKHKIFNLF